MLIPPFDHLDIISGQGTVAKELIEEVGRRWINLGQYDRRPSPVAPLPDYRRGTKASRRRDPIVLSGKLERTEKTNTIADGARSVSLGALTFPIVLEHVSDMVTVSDAAIARSMFYLWERLKIVVEPTGALAATALLEGIVSQPGSKIGIIISGGNIDLKQMPTYWTKAHPKEKAAAKRPWTWEMS